MDLEISKYHFLKKRYIFFNVSNTNNFTEKNYIIRYIRLTQKI